MNTPEFVDTYSDDLGHLLDARTALLTHPLRLEIKEAVDASTCRLLAILMIGSIELMLANWQERDHNDILKTYFAKKRQNGERVAAFIYRVPRCRYHR